jgi:probable rRNA maturation factor
MGPNSRKSITFWLTGDRHMRSLNQKVFGHFEQTDVISFPINEEMKKTQTDYLGEIVVNQDEVARNATQFGVKYDEELARVVAHGVLHLLGYEDGTVQGKAAMKSVEDSVIKRISQGSTRKSKAK